MATYTADIAWTLESDGDFPSGRYSCGHMVRFDGGIAVPASASPHVVGDGPSSVMETIAPGREAVTRVVLHPRIEWAGTVPNNETLSQLHHDARESCFIGNSVRTNAIVAPTH